MQMSLHCILAMIVDNEKREGEQLIMINAVCYSMLTCACVCDLVSMLNIVEVNVKIDTARAREAGRMSEENRHLSFFKIFSFPSSPWRLLANHPRLLFLPSNDPLLILLFFFLVTE